jgi:hypothetical protein
MSSFGTLIKTIGFDTFIVKYNSSGIAQWATSLGGNGTDVGYGITTDLNNNVYVTGEYISNPLEISSFSTVSSGVILMSSFGTLSNNDNTTNAFIVKYNSSGIAQWATRLGGNSAKMGNGIVTDTNNNVYITGSYFSDSLEISSFSTVSSGVILMSSFGTLINTTINTTDTFIVKYNSSGIVQAATSLGGIRSDVGNSITTDLNNNVFVTGSYASNTLQISGFSTVSSGVVLLSSFGTLLNVSTSGTSDAFVVKMNSSLQFY